MSSAEIKAILDRRRTASDAPKDTDLFPVFNFLFDAQVHGSDDATGDRDLRHWYCPKSPSPLHTDAATFLLFLLAFKQEGNAKAFADSLSQLLSRCESCARGFARARRRFNQEFFSLFTPTARGNFFAVVDRRESELILGASRNGHSSSAPLNALPRAVLYILLYEPSLWSNDELSQLITADIDSASPIIPALGLTPFLASALGSSDVRRREWAMSHLPAAKQCPASMFDWDAGVGIEVQKLYVEGQSWDIVATLAESGSLQTEALQHGLIEGTVDSRQTQRGAGAMLLARVGNDDDRFPSVLRAFASLLHASPSRHMFSHDISPTLPHAIFIAIKNNPAYQRMADTPVRWMTDFLLSVKDTSSDALREVLADVAAFCLVEMQHERLDSDIRARFAEAGCKSLHELLPHAAPIANLHAPVIATLAFGPQSCAAAADLYSAVLEADANELLSCILGAATVVHAERKRLYAVKRGKHAASPARVQLLRPELHLQLWAAAYDRVAPHDAAGTALIMRCAARVAHFEPLRKSLGWSSADLGDVVDKDAWVEHIAAINNAMTVIVDPLHGIVEALQSEACKNFWLPEATQAATLLLLSPREAVHEPIIGLIQQSFDNVDDRADCFRALLEHHPGPTMDGLERSLLGFLAAAHVLPEACSLAKWLVRCFTDVLEALCRPSGSNAPLLQSDAFINTSTTTRMPRRISKLWHLMTAVLTLILKRTLDWAPFYENEVMTDWMRDALIFGRAMTDNIRAFEGAVLGRTSTAVTQTGKVLVNGLGAVLKSLVLWLRLTDAETLHQTYELIKAIVSLIAKTRLGDADTLSLQPTLLEIDKFCRRVSKSYNCRLADDRLSELADLLAQFDLPAIEEPVVDKTPSLPPKRDAFAMLMGKPGKTQTAASPSTSRHAPGSSKAPITVDDFDDDPLLLSLSSADLDILERRAQAKVAPKKTGPPPASRPAAPPAAKPAPTKFASKFMREQAAMHKAVLGERKRMDVVRADAPRPPPPSKIGTGLGAYQGGKRAATAVDSGSSASESSDEDTPGLAGNKPKSPAKRFSIPNVPTRSTKVLGPSYADIMRERNAQMAAARATKLRLHPDVWPLYRIILAWDPDYRGPLQLKDAARRVPITFNSSDEYDQVLLPLFLRELWAQFLKEDSRDVPVTADIAGRTYEDDFVDLEVVISVWPQTLRLYDTDIVTLRQDGAKPVYAKVQSVRRKPKDSAVKLRLLTQMDSRELGARSKWRLQKHISLSTTLREFAALRGLPYYDASLLADIMAARSAALPRHSHDEIDAAMRIYGVNEPQAGAILGALQVQGFALIQGPPGTGKTKTICGLVGKFMADRKVGVAVAGEKAAKPKLLICAPSNAAIDEVCKRLLDGVPGPHGRQTLSIVRIGVEAAVNIAVKNVSLDNLIEARVSADSANAGDGEYAQLQQELEGIKKSIVAKQSEIAAAPPERKRLLETSLHELQSRRNMLGQRASKAKDAVRDATRHLEGARRTARDAVLGDADVICATLSGAGHESLKSYTFETVIVDEAAQAIELSCLIPLKYGCKRCIMIGDPKQLPPTTFDQDSERLHYNQSLFVRIAQQRGSMMHLLSIQYRMHPFISELPSKVFYDGRLRDGPGMADKTAAIWHQRQVLGPYRFFHVAGVEQRAGTSTKNSVEAGVAVQLFRCLDEGFSKHFNVALRIGVITMYREQLVELKRRFSEAFGASILDQIEFNTVDGFQGQEKDIIVLSCVRSGPNLSSIGFLRDFRRINVALTRAKSSLFVIGDANTLERSDDRWKIIVGDARDRGFLVEYTDRTFSSTPTSPRAKPKKRPSMQPEPKKPRSPASKTPTTRPPTPDVKPARAGDAADEPVAPPARPPALPPVPPAKRPLPVANKAPPRATEDVLFIKKKKKNPPSSSSSGVNNVRATINHSMAHHK